METPDLDADGCYKDRNCMHKWMAPPDHCDKCYGRGHYPEVDADGYETGTLYCGCAAGRLRHKVDGGDDGQA
jgi:hypothetical protein